MTKLFNFVNINVELIYNNTYQFTQFTYSVPKSLQSKVKIGSIVNVVFRNKDYKAVVVNLQNTSKNNYKILDIKSYLYDLTKEQILYLKYLAVSNFLNMGIVLSQYEDLNVLISQKTLNISKNSINPLNNFINELRKEKKNVIFVDSIKKCNEINELLKRNNIKLDFYQKTGGKAEIKNYIHENKNYKNICVLGHNFNLFKLDNDVTYNFYDINNVSYTLPKLNNINIIESSLYKNLIFGGNFKFYSEFPPLDLFSNIDNFKNLSIYENLIYLNGNSVEDCIDLFNKRFENKNYNFFTFSEIIKDKLNDFYFTNKLNSINTEKFILLNPNINYKNTLNSLRLISLIRQLEYCMKNNIEVLILSTKGIDINESFSYENLKILSSNEILERHNYGPNINKKVYSFNTSKDDNKITNSKYIIGPRKVDNLFQYEMNIILSKNINYNDIMDLFSSTIKFSPKKVRNI